MNRQIRTVRTIKFAILVGLIVASSGPLTAKDWPQWGGPGRDHVSEENGLLQDWPAAGPERVWLNADAGLGYAGVAVAGGKIFTIGARNNAEFLIVMNEADGKEIWATRIGDILRNNWGDGPRSTPTVDGNQVFALGGQGNLIAASISDGKILWQKSMQDLGGNVPGWGYTESVLVDEGNVYCTPGGKQGALAALDRKTGAVKWRATDLDDGAQYASLRVMDISGQAQLVQLLTKRVVGVEKASGKLLWSSDFPGRTAVIPSPVVHENSVYVTAGYGAGCKLVRINKKNEVEEVYDNKVMKNHHGGVLLMGDHIYGYSDGPGWVCQNFKTGEEVWASKKLGKGAVTGTGNRLYCLEENSGTVVLAEASASGWKEFGRFKLEAQSKQRSRSGAIWTHPVIANGKLYLRDQELLSCYDISAK